ncbi:hypothetical protein [Clostridium botulinum]|uniref:Uncharacterized protein n=1 Tax=Clostridium botulinum B2 450 TaxID=1379739 RepID=A0A0D0ZT90_CLOBO|nr:hypothetical protein [Clostridium botulinum]KIS22003.1 hypothetical protein N495_16040 [Clostridium botulinum B2 450]
MNSKLSFKNVFFISVLFIPFYKIFKYLDKFPPICIYGDIIYNLLDVFLDIINQISIGIAGAIVFYYLNLFLEFKKNNDVYNVPRKMLMRVLVDNMDFLGSIPYFKKLENYKVYSDRRVFVIKFLELINEEKAQNKNAENYTYQNVIKEYFLETDNGELIKFIDSLKDNINNLQNLSLKALSEEISCKIEQIDIHYHADLFVFGKLLAFEERDNSSEERDNSSEEYIKYCKDNMFNYYISILDNVIESYTMLTDLDNAVSGGDILSFIKFINAMD